MYSINNKYSVIYILIECLLNTENCDWTNYFFANLVVNFPKSLKHAFLLTLHDTNSATS